MLQHKICLVSILILVCISTVSNKAVDFFKGIEKNVKQEEGLYVSSDHVQIIDASTFDLDVYGNSRPMLIEFYNAWCGHCKRFAPLYKEFGAITKKWQDLVGIAVIACSDDANQQICRNFEIMSYPTLRFYHENFEKAPSALGENVEPVFNSETLVNNLIDKLAGEQNQGRAQSLPNLLPFNSSDLRSIYDRASNADHAFLFIIPNEEHYEIQRMALDYHKQSKIIIRYTNITDLNRAALEKIGINQSGYVAILDKDGGVNVLPIEGKSRDFLQNKLKLMGLLLKETESKEISTEKVIVGPDLVKIIQMGDKVYQADLELALRYSLKSELGMKKNIMGEKLTALRRYILVLAKYFPIKDPSLWQYLNQTIHASDMILGIDIRKQEIDAENLGILPSKASKPSWIGCRGSDVTKRGYPCGLWKMFHYLTVNAALSGGGTGNEVLLAMHGYIKHFFGCSDCSNHFQEMAAQRKLTEVSTADDAILWLWESHNVVNKRLAGDQTEDPIFPKVQFPSQKNCPQCYTSQNEFDRPQVLKYLKQIYGNNNINKMTYEELTSDHVIPNDFDAMNDTKQNGINGGPADFANTSMLFLLYLCSFVLIIVLIRMFFAKKLRYRKKPYVHDLLGKV